MVLTFQIFLATHYDSPDQSYDDHRGHWSHRGDHLLENSAISLVERVERFLGLHGYGHPIHTELDTDPGLQHYLFNRGLLLDELRESQDSVEL